MIYLVMKMLVYLAVAMAAGFGAGWLIRNLTATRKEDELQRALGETKSRLPQLESLMRTRDEQLNNARAELKDKDARIGELRAQMDSQQKTLKERERDLKNAQARLAVLDELDDGSVDLQALESRLRETALDRDRLSKALEQEKRRITELERERELQNRSLLVLHQQLELARESSQRATG